MTPADGTRTAEALNRLTEGITKLTTSRAWLDYLETARRFHAYSFGNILLIHAQLPDATRVAGFKTWRGLGRSVRRGEHAIWILAPVTRRPERDETDEQTDDERLVTGFRAVPVFDISQTDGEPLPEPRCTRLTGDDPSGSYERLREVAQRLGYTVDEDCLPGEVNGDCNFTNRRIRIEARNDGLQRVKSLAHEVAHALLHESFDGPRELAELEAESVAYIVCDGLNLDSTAYSFGYVANWAGGGEEAIAGIKASGARIQSAARQILDGVSGVTVPEMA